MSCACAKPLLATAVVKRSLVSESIALEGRMSMVPESENVDAAALAVTERDVVVLAPSSSVTVRLIVNVPASVYVWEARGPTPVCPLPKFH